jgi:hypothetical protein
MTMRSWLGAPKIERPAVYHNQTSRLIHSDCAKALARSVKYLTFFPHKMWERPRLGWWAIRFHQRGTLPLAGSPTGRMCCCSITTKIAFTSRSVAAPRENDLANRRPPMPSLTTTLGGIIAAVCSRCPIAT